MDPDVPCIKAKMASSAAHLTMLSQSNPLPQSAQVSIAPEPLAGLEEHLARHQAWLQEHWSQTKQGLCWALTADSRIQRTQRWSQAATWKYPYGARLIQQVLSTSHSNSSPGGRGLPAFINTPGSCPPKTGMLPQVLCPSHWDPRALPSVGQRVWGCGVASPGILYCEEKDLIHAAAGIQVLPLQSTSFVVSQQELHMVCSGVI